jgi:hypothetical protein
VSITAFRGSDFFLWHHCVERVHGQPQDLDAIFYRDRASLKQELRLHEHLLVVWREQSSLRLATTDRQPLSLGSPSDPMQILIQSFLDDPKIRMGERQSEVVSK